MNPPATVAEIPRVQSPQLVSTVTRGVESIKNYISMTRADVLAAIRNAETAVLTPLERGMSATVRPLSPASTEQVPAEAPPIITKQLNLNKDVTVAENATCVALGGIEIKSRAAGLCGPLDACCQLTKFDPELHQCVQDAIKEVRLLGSSTPEESEVAAD